MIEGIISLLLTVYLVFGLIGIALCALLFLIAGAKFIKACISQPSESLKKSSEKKNNKKDK